MINDPKNRIEHDTLEFALLELQSHLFRILAILQKLRKTMQNKEH